MAISKMQPQTPGPPASAGKGTQFAQMPGPEGEVIALRLASLALKDNDTACRFPLSRHSFRKMRKPSGWA